MWLANDGFALLAFFEFLTLLWKFIEERERERERERQRDRETERETEKT